MYVLLLKNSTFYVFFILIFFSDIHSIYRTARICSVVSWVQFLMIQEYRPQARQRRAAVPDNNLRSPEYGKAKSKSDAVYLF